MQWARFSTGQDPKGGEQMITDKTAAPTSAAKAIDPFDPDSFKEPAIMTSGTTATSMQDATPVKVLVFDMGHVFVDFDWSAVCQGFMDRAGMDREQFKEVLAYVGTLGYEDGRVTTEEFVKALNEKLSLSMTIAEFEALWNFGFHENAEMAALLTELGKTYPLYLLSNTNESHHKFLTTTYKVERLFKESIFSHKVGFTKPDRRIYDEVITRSGFPPEAHVFVDDLERNVQGAQAVGMRTVRFIGIEDLKEKLRELGIEV
jgi:FMN phosphatase YigB (HAD superfamily)